VFLDGQRDKKQRTFILRDGVGQRQRTFILRNGVGQRQRTFILMGGERGEGALKQFLESKDVKNVSARRKDNLWIFMGQQY